MSATVSKKVTRPTSRTRSIAFVALTIAIMAVSAWVTVPIGPVPFTLQMFAITFAIIVLSPREAMAATCGYLLLGAIGVPVFSSMRGGIGVLAGPTGGFLWGYIFGVAAGVGLLYLVRRAKGGRTQVATLTDVEKQSGARKALAFVRNFGFELLAGILFTVIAYACGCVQYMVFANVDLWQALLVCVVPFAVVDLCKIVAAVIVAEAVLAATRR